MKIKHTKAPRHTEYLGHFRGCLKEGHNNSGSAAYKENVRGDMPSTDRPMRHKTPPSGGVRG